MLRTFRTLVFIGVLLSFIPLAEAAERLTVVELFTSQGCSSCPPADGLLGDLAERPELLALSEHIDYWDYLGWHDPFALADNTRRQRKYARRLGQSYVYTPQFVVHGMMQNSGTDRLGLLHLINEAQKQPARISVDIDEHQGGGLAARLGEAALPVPADVWLVRFDPVHVTTIGDGENGGRSIRNVNVVRDFTLIGRWSGDRASLPLPKIPSSDSRYAVLVQESDAGPILGATRLTIPQR